MDGSGTPSPSGPTEFVVGTGGHSLQSFVSSDPRVAYSLAGSFGAFQLDLNPGGASYQYMTTGGGTVDSGTVACNPNGTDTTPPSTPTGLNASTVAQTSISPGLVNLTWSASTDNVAVASYKIFRDGNQVGNLVGTVGPQTSFSDNGVAPNTNYSYTLQAVDWKGNPSGVSTVLLVTTPPAAAIFSDGFESGGLSNWDTVNGLTLESSDVADGSYAAESIGDGTSAGVGYAWKTLPSTQPNLYYELHFKIVSRGSGTSVFLQRFRTGYGAPSGSANAILGVYVSSTGKLAFQDTASANTVSSTSVSTGAWHTLQAHVNVTTGQVDVWLDGTLALTATGKNLGPDPVGIIQLGESSGNKTYDVLYDDVAVDTVQLP
jgi:hypothetical protein